jgi:hypothetical protein
MAISKKGLRKITVAKHEYVWRAISNGDGGFNITISQPDRKGQLLMAYVHIISERGVLIITNYIVRQVILLALESNWTPGEQKAPLRINEQIDLARAIYWDGEKITTANIGLQ